MSGMNIKSWERSELFRLSGPDITSKHSRSLDINNYIRSNRYYTRSDKRLKYNIEDLSNCDIEKLNAIIPKQYRSANDDLLHFGFIAQEVEELFPNLVNEDNQGIKSLNYLEMIPLLLHKINHLERIIKELKNN